MPGNAEIIDINKEYVVPLCLQRDRNSGKIDKHKHGIKAKARVAYCSSYKIIAP